MAIMREAARRDSGAARGAKVRRSARGVRDGGVQTIREHGACRANPWVGRIRFRAAAPVSAGLAPVLLDERGHGVEDPALLLTG